MRPKQAGLLLTALCLAACASIGGISDRYYAPKNTEAGAGAGGAAGTGGTGGSAGAAGKPDTGGGAGVGGSGGASGSAGSGGAANDCVLDTSRYDQCIMN